MILKIDSVCLVCWCQKLWEDCCDYLANYCSYVYFFLFQSSLWSAVAAASANWVSPLFRFMQFMKYVCECSSCFCLNWIASFAFRPPLQFQALLILILSYDLQCYNACGFYEDALPSKEGFLLPASKGDSYMSTD